MKRTATLFLAMLLVCSTAGAALAMERTGDTVPVRTAALYPTDVVESMEDGNRRLEKIYLLTAADDPSHIPTEDFEREGYRYTLLDVTRQDYTESETKEHTEKFTLKSKTKDMDKIMPQLAATKEVTTEDGFVGVLTLDTTSVQVETAGYGSSSRTVTATRSYPNLSDADVSLIPKTISDDGRTLTLADVQWQEAGGFYHASASYTGTATSRYATGYTISASYTGEVTKTIDGELIYTAVFSGSPINNVVRDEPEPDTADKDTEQPGDAEPDEGNSLKWLFVFPAAAAVAGLIFGGKYLHKTIRAKKEWRDYTK